MFFLLERYHTIDLFQDTLKNFYLLIYLSLQERAKKNRKRITRIKNINYPKTSEYLKTRKNLPLLDYIEIMTSTFTLKCNYSDFNYINRDDILETNLRAGFEYTKT